MLAYCFLHLKNSMEKKKSQLNWLKTRHSLHILTSSQRAVTPLSGPEVYIAMLCILCYVIVIGEAFFFFLCLKIWIWRASRAGFQLPCSHSSQQHHILSQVYSSVGMTAGSKVSSMTFVTLERPQKLLMCSPDKKLLIRVLSAKNVNGISSIKSRERVKIWTSKLIFLHCMCEFSIYWIQSSVNGSIKYCNCTEHVQAIFSHYLNNTI